MQKSKSASLSEKDKQKIIAMIHSKVTPLKFKFKKNQKHLHTNLLLLPQLQKSQLQESGHRNGKKRVSVSTYIENNSPFVQETIHKVELRENFLSTESIKKQQEQLTALYQQFQFKENCHSSPFLIQPFENCSSQLPVQLRDKLRAQLIFLQKKKMLKNVKHDVENKKKLFLEMIGQNQIKRSQKMLQKKYNPKFKPSFKHSSHKSTGSNELLNYQSDSKHELIQKKPLRNSVDLRTYETTVTEQKNDEGQSTQLKIKQQQREGMKLREFIEFFKNDRSENSKIVIQQCLKQRNEKSSKFLYHKSYDDENEAPFHEKRSRNRSLPLSQMLGNAEKLNQSAKFKPRKGFINKTLQFGLDSNKQGAQNTQSMDISWNNAKLRLKSNHKKLVALGKMSAGKKSHFGSLRIE